MKLLLLIYSGPTPQRIAALLEAHEAPGYTQFENARGAGGTGRIEGTRAWPGTATVFMSVVPAERAEALRREVALLEGTIESAWSSPPDRAIAGASDLQGFGSRSKGTAVEERKEAR